MNQYLSALSFVLLYATRVALAQEQTTLTYVSSVPSGFFTSIAVSYSGQYIAACSNGYGIYTSSNYGYDWVQTSSASTPWLSIASSSSGENLVAVTDAAGIYVSTDYGDSWTLTSAPSTYTYYSVASSASGQYLFTGPYSTGDFIYSANNGTDWFSATDASGTFQNSKFTGVTCSGNGMYVVVSTYSNGLWVSDNYGVYFEQVLAVENLSSVASSTDGSFAAVTAQDGTIYLSTSYGYGWVQSGAPNGYDWTTVAMCGDGQYLAAGIFEGSIFVSSDFGAVWAVSQSDINAWKFISMSETGQFIAAVTNYETVGGLGNVFMNYYTPTSSPSSSPTSVPSTGTPSSRPSTHPTVKPNSALPTSWPSSFPSNSPSSRPTQNPTYIAGTADINAVVYSSSNTSSYVFTNLGCGSKVYLSASILVSYLSTSSNGFLNITAGSTTSTIDVSSCAPTSSCGGTVCAINVEVTDAMICEVGGSLEVTAITVNADLQSGLQSICTYKGTQNLLFVMSYTLSAYPQPTFKPTVAPTDAANSDGLIFNASPNTPFFIIVAVVSFFIIMGIFIVRMKDTSGAFGRVSLVSTMLDWAIAGYHLTSELVYVVVLFNDGHGGIAAIIIFMRLLSIVPALYYLYITFGPTSAHYGSLLNKKHLLRNASLYSVVTILMLIEQSLVRYLPWKYSQIVVLSRGYPDVAIFKLSSRFKLCQLTATLVVQIVVLVDFEAYLFHGSSNRIALAVVLLYLFSSLSSFLLAFFVRFLTVGVFKKGNSDTEKNGNPMHDQESTGRETELSVAWPGDSSKLHQLQEREKLLTEDVTAMRGELSAVKELLNSVTLELQALKVKDVESS